MQTTKQFMAFATHLGHKTNKWNPKNSLFLLAVRHGICLIDTEQTILMIRRALSFVKDICGYSHMKIHGKIICVSSTFSKRILAGFRGNPTNPVIISTRFLFIPEAFFCLRPLDLSHLGLPIIAIIDSDSDPQGIDFPIPGNDDSIESINLYLSLFRNAILQTKKSNTSSIWKKNEIK